jgi:hypothetical protein
MSRQGLVSIAKVAGITIGTVITGGGYYMSAYELVDRIWGLPVGAWQGIGVFIFSATLVAIVLGDRDNQKAESVKKVSRQKQQADGSDGIEFFPTMDDLRARHPLSETFKPGNEIHASFLSGEGVFAEHNDYIKCVKRLILPKPDAPTIATLQTFLDSYIDYRTQIPTYRSLAQRNHVPVRLFQDFIGLSLLFCNPDRQDGWVQVGIIVPGQPSAERPHWRIYRNKHEKAVLSLYNTFDKLWKASEEQTEEEVMEQGFRDETNRIAGLPPKRAAAKRDMLKIDYKFEEVQGQEGYFNWFTEGKNGPSIQLYSIKIVNHGSRPINNVEVKLETIEQFETEIGGKRLLEPRKVSYPLKFKKSGTYSATIHGNDSEWVPVLSFSHPTPWISIEGIGKQGGGIDQEGKLMSPDKPYQIEIVARAEGQEDRAQFSAQVEYIAGIGRLWMKRL